MVKVRLSINDIPFSGYLNIDPNPIIEQDKNFDNIVKNSILNIDAYVDDNECEEILAPNVLNYISYKKIPVFLLHLKKKLKKDGELIIGGSDFSLLSRSLNFEAIDLNTLNEFLFGKQSAPSEFKKSTITMMELTKIAQNAGFTVVEQFAENHNMYVRLKIG